MIDALLTPTGLFLACMFLIFGVLLPLLIWDEAIKAGERLDFDTPIPRLITTCEPCQAVQDAQVEEFRSEMDARWSA